MSEFKITEQDKDTQRLWDATIIHLYKERTCMFDSIEEMELLAENAINAATILMQKRAEFLKGGV